MLLQHRKFHPRKRRRGTCSTYTTIIYKMLTSNAIFAAITFALLRKIEILGDMRECNLF